MTTAVLVALLVVVVTQALLNEPVGWVLRRRMKRTMLVTMKAGESYRGLLFQVDRHSLVLRNTEVVTAGDHVPVDGELVLSRAEVAYLQRV